jgi:uncharacterized protein YcbX
MLQISQLYIYPIKSLGGIAVTSARVTTRGFEHDRRWMLVDENNRFLSQRESAKMALLKVELKNDGLFVTYHPSGGSILIPHQSSTPETCEVTVWDDTCTAVYVSHEADKWFTDILGIKCRLVYMPDYSIRPVDEKHVPSGHITSFADAYPYLLIGQATLDDLNSRLTEKLPMNRFRPNIIFTGGESFEEDIIDNFTVGNIDFYGVKLCARCVITTIDQNIATKANEPLKTLATYRRRNSNVYFGQNLIHKGEGVVTVGDMMEVKNYHHEEKFIV